MKIRNALKICRPFQFLPIVDTLKPKGTSLIPIPPNPSIFLFAHHIASSFHSPAAAATNQESFGFLFSSIQNLEDALFFFHRMTQIPRLHSVEDFTQLLGAVVRMEHYCVAISMFLKIRSLDIPVDDCTLNLVINCYCHLNYFDLGVAVLGCFYKFGFVPDVRTYNTLLKGLYLEDRIPEALQLLEKLIRQRVIVSHESMFGGLIYRLCKAVKTGTTIWWLRKIDEINCRPNAVAYATVIDNLFKNRKVDDALQLLSDMVQQGGFQPTVVSYCSLIHVLCNLDRLKDIKELLKEMASQKIFPNAWTFNVLVDAYCKKGMVKNAEDVLYSMIKIGEKPGLVTYSALMNGFCLLGRMNDAMRVFSSMVDWGFKHNNYSYNILINGYCKMGSFDDALQLLHEMPRKGLKPDLITYTTVLRWLIQAMNYTSGLEVLTEKRASGENCFTFSALMDGLSKNEYFVEVLRMMESDDLSPDICFYTFLISKFCKDGRIDIARALFDDLPSKGLQPNVKTYTVIIHGLCSRGSIDEAQELLMKMKNNGCPPDDITFKVLVRALLKRNDCDKAMQLLEEMLGKGFTPDSSILSFLIEEVQDSTVLDMIGNFVPEDIQSTS